MKKKLKCVELRFRAGAIRKLVVHACSCDQRLPLDEEDAEAVKPGLVLISDTSLYVASNGADQSELVGRIEYAQGFKPALFEDEVDMVAKKERLIGERADVIFFKAEDVEEVLGSANDWDLFRVSVLTNGEGIVQAMMLPPATRLEALKWAETRLAA